MNDTHTATIDWGDGPASPARDRHRRNRNGQRHPRLHGVGHLHDHRHRHRRRRRGGESEHRGGRTARRPRAGGPYAGLEGAPVTLNGSAVDPEADALLVGWTSTIVTADPGTTCSMTDTTLTPSLVRRRCARRVTLTVADGVNPVSDTVVVTIANARRPWRLRWSSRTRPPSARRSRSARLHRSGRQRRPYRHRRVGDAIEPGAVVEVPGSGTITGTHLLGPRDLHREGHGERQGRCASSSATAVVVNGTPTVTPVVPTRPRRLARDLTGSATDPEGDPLSIVVLRGLHRPGRGCTAAGTATLAPAVTCNDDATIVATLTATDGVNPPVMHTATITIANQAPAIGPSPCRAHRFRSAPRSAR